MSPVSEAKYLARENTRFLSTATIKQLQKLTNLKNPKIVCSYHHSCIDLPMALVDFQAEGCLLRLHHVCQGEYVVLNGINFDGAEPKICRDCAENLREWEKSETLKMVGDRTI